MADVRSLTAFWKHKSVSSVHGPGMSHSCSANSLQNSSQCTFLKFLCCSAFVTGSAYSSVVRTGTWLVPGPRSLGSVSHTTTRLSMLVVANILLTLVQLPVAIDCR